MTPTQDWGAVNVGSGAAGGKVKKPTTARGIDAAKASGAIATEKRYGAGGNASAHSGGIMSAKKVRVVHVELLQAGLLILMTICFSISHTSLCSLLLLSVPSEIYWL